VWVLVDLTGYKDLLESYCMSPHLPPNPSIEKKNINTNTKNLYEIFIRCVFIKELSASTDFLGLVLDGWPYRPYSVFYQGPSGLKRLRLKCKSFGPNQKVSHF